MARAMTWPVAHVAPQLQADAPAPTLLEGLDAAGFAAGLGPELSRLFGVRIGARLALGEDRTTVFLAAGQIRLAGSGGVVPLDVLLDVAGAAVLVERLFGSVPGPGADLPDRLSALPPGSGSWMSPCRFVATAIGRAMAAVGHPVAGAPLLPARAVQAAVPPGTEASMQLALLLDIDGWAAVLRLVDPSLPPAPVPPEPAPAPDLDLWRRRARANALALDLPVTLRLADARTPLAEVAALKAGDVIPLVPPRMLTVLVAGKRFQEIPADALGGDAAVPARRQEPFAPGVARRVARTGHAGDGA
jgi:hypothetical protein